jgi:hypothetical protein
MDAFSWEDSFVGDGIGFVKTPSKLSANKMYQCGDQPGIPGSTKRTLNECIISAKQNYEKIKKSEDRHGSKFLICSQN